MAEHQRVAPDCRVSLGGARLAGEQDAALFKVEVDLDVDLFGQAVLSFSDPKLTLINGKDLAPGTAVTVEIGYASRLVCVFEGEVVALEPQFRRDQPVTLRVVCLETLHRLALQTMTRSFNNVDDKEILTQIARENGLSAEAEAGSKEHILQANISDAAFLRRLAQKQGMHLRIEGKKLILGEPPAGDDLTVRPGSGLRRLKVRIKAGGQVGQVAVHGYDPKTKKEFVGRSKGEGEAAQGARSFGKGADVAIAGHEAQPADVATAEKMAKGRMRKLAEGFITAYLDLVGDPQVIPGAALAFEKLGPKLDGRYRVESAHHLWSKHGYRTQLKAVRVGKPPAPPTAKPPPGRPAASPVPEPPPAQVQPPQEIGGTRFEATVVDALGNPKRSFFYRLVKAGAPEQAGLTDADGKLVVTLPSAGEWKLIFPDADGAQAQGGA